MNEMDVYDAVLKRDLLDHGFVRLVAYMQPATRGIALDSQPVDLTIKALQPGWSGDLEVVRNARTSYDAHYRQWHRHRTQAYSEQSARYGELPEIFYVPAVEDLRVQHLTEKQQSSSHVHPEAEMWIEAIDQQCRAAFNLYKQMLENGVAREMARIVLPLNTYSRMFCTVNLHNLFHFIQLRADEHAQKQIQVYAEAMLELIANVVPVCVEAFQLRTGVGVE